MSKTSPSIIDHNIGKNLKLKRIKAGKSLQELADVLNVSFQQIQKYERGQNKIASSSLFLLSEALNVKINDFFSGSKDGFNTDSNLAEEKEIFEHIDTIPNHEMTLLIKSYSQIKNHTVRKKTLELIKSLHESEENYRRDAVSASC